ncbi:hypothetical protein [Sphingomonas sp.]|uniref:hypothetical protein n=1 Tax=Sphingomonas sp. TaxID=28214 RepID=UPI0026180CD4|nr:hypothetical protein [Sphingomonas sp.]
MARKVFWSWQSDQPARETRDVIKAALQRALSNLQAEFEEAERPDIDHDTKDVPGSPDIVAAILEKIDAAAVFVADVTPIAVSGSGKHVANPNVLIELGYAKRALRLSRVIQVWNTALTGATVEDLPFDMRQRRKPIEFALAVGADREELRAVRDGLQKDLEHALRLALASLPAEPPTPLPWQTPDPTFPAIWRGGVVQVNMDEETIHLAFESNPAGYARLLPTKWSSSPSALARFDRDNSRPIPLGRVGGMSWGAAAGGFLVTRWSEKIEREHVSSTGTRWFRDTGEFWGIDGRFVGSSSEGDIFATEYAVERWITWIAHHYQLCRSLGGSGSIHVRLGLVGLEGSRWPRGVGGYGRGPGALEDRAEHDFVLSRPDDIDEQIKVGVSQMMRNAATAYGL